MTTEHIPANWPRSEAVRLTPEEVQEKERIEAELAQPSRWLAEAIHPDSSGLPVSAAHELTPEDLRAAEDLADRLQAPSPWLQ